MGYISIQPDDYSASLIAIKHLSLTSECSFDFPFNRPRLRHILFRSRSSMTYEWDYHSFISEVVYGHYAIAVHQKDLWGTNFYCLCDCSAIKEVLEYNGNIHQLKCWSQELLANEFVIIHRPNKIMKDVDTISRFTRA